MQRIMKKRSAKAGLPPGTPVLIGERKTEKAKITLFDYDEGKYYEKEWAGVEDCLKPREKGVLRWVNIDGLSDMGALEAVCSGFGIHPLVIEDIADTDQRPKVEDYESYLYIVLKMIEYEKESVDAEQVSIVLGPDFVLTFQENTGDVFDSVRERIRSGKGRIRKSGADYLAYALIDRIVDNYFSILEGYGERIELMEEELITNPVPATLRKLHRMKTDMIILRRSVWPLRDVIGMMERAEATKSSLIRRPTKIYLRDVYDHTVQVIDNVETFRDMSSGMLDIYLSSVSNRLNEVMKVLTVIATIFIPLTFIVGVYGMNFKDMPELQLEWGYAGVWAVMAVVSLAMILYFRKRRWV
ncbi:MAG: magnesium/cobalt transporter CorA [Candidatus Micrarchaeia archaeon]